MSNKQKHGSSRPNEYSRVSKAPTYSSLPIAPIDKIWMKVPSSINVDVLERYRTEKRLDLFRPYKTDSVFSFVCKLPTGALVTIYRNSIQTMIQINPTQWDSLEAIVMFLGLILEGEFRFLQIIRLHCHIDIPEAISEVMKAIEIPRKRGSDSFDPLLHKKYASGRLREISITNKYGNRKTEAYSIYDSSERHGFKPPMTRIEHQANSKDYLLARSLYDLISLDSKKPFKKLRLTKVEKNPRLSRRNQERLELLTLLSEKTSRPRAISVLRRRDPKHFDRDFREVLSCVVTDERYDLNLLFQNRFKDFRDAKVSDAEKIFLASLEKTIQLHNTSCSASPAPHSNSGFYIETKPEKHNENNQLQESAR